MSDFADYEFISPDDKPALLALSSMAVLANAQTIVLECGYKVHVASNHEDFARRFNTIPYQLVIVEELFAARTPAENVSLLSLQSMPMARRRHATVILTGSKVQTFNRLQAFQQSVHAVINNEDLSSLGQLLQRTVEENELFLTLYRDVQGNLARRKR